MTVKNKALKALMIRRITAWDFTLFSQHKRSSPWKRPQ